MKNFKIFKLKNIYNKKKIKTHFSNLVFKRFNGKVNSNLSNLIVKNLKLNLKKKSKKNFLNSFVFYKTQKNLRNFSKMELNLKKQLKVNCSNINNFNFFSVNYYLYLIELNGFLSLEPYKNMYTLMSQLKLNFCYYYRLFKRVKKAKNYNYDFSYLVNLLKIKQKFQYITNDFLKRCSIYFKYTGSNMFGTIINSLGQVLYSYSAGTFRNVRTRKEKTTIFIAKQLGELIALRVYKSNAFEISFIPFINHRKVRSLVKFLSNGFRLIRYFKLSKFFVNRRVMRNGVRLRKIARK